jgi:hypothetical protein
VLADGLSPEVTAVIARAFERHRLEAIYLKRATSSTKLMGIEISNAATVLESIVPRVEIIE